MKYYIVPCAKPRMTISDKWKKRPCIMKYWAFTEECRLKKVRISDWGSVIKFHIPMPKSWSKKKKAEMDGRPHQQRPDIDNLLKALLDAVLKEDCRVWSVSVSKVWAQQGAIEIT